MNDLNPQQSQAYDLIQPPIETNVLSDLKAARARLTCECANLTKHGDRYETRRTLLNAVERLLWEHKRRDRA